MGTISVKFMQGGLAVDPVDQLVNLTVVAADGTIVVAADTPTVRSSVGVYTYNLSPAHTALLNTLTASWESQDLGTLTTIVEVVGGFLFTIEELRRTSNQLANTATYPTAELVAVRTRVEQALEKRLGYALVPRYTRETIFSSSNYLRLRPYVRTIRTATSAGTALTVGDLTALVYGVGGIITGYCWGYPTIIGYEHGRDGIDEEAKQVALILAKVWLLPSSLDDRASTFTSVEGGTYALATAGRGGSTFGIPLVDEFVQSERLVAIA